MNDLCIIKFGVYIYKLDLYFNMNGFKRLIHTNIDRMRKRDRTSVQLNWKKALISLYIIRNTDGICLYYHHFQLGSISQIETQLVGMGFSAMSKMMQEIVDSNSHLSLIDLDKKKVIIEEKGDLLGILVTVDYSSVIREKLIELLDYFEKIFQLQREISSLGNHVCLEDYALTSELVDLVFEKQPLKVLEIVPLIFKSIRNGNISTPSKKNNISHELIRKYGSIINIQKEN